MKVIVDVRTREVNTLSAYDEKAILDILEKVSKSVVNISTIKLVAQLVCFSILPTLASESEYPLASSFGSRLL